ncbi:MAG: GAF domain-containing protein, partial [Dehalococcoidia bacterium]|nr:GAF domain-containing protein [Dehalococcoidia bacterium]
MTVRDMETATMQRRLRIAQERIAELEALQRRNRRVSGVLTRLATLADHSPSAIVEFDGAVTYLNNAAREKFPTLVAMGVNHPLLAGLDAIVDEMRRTGLIIKTREVGIGESIFRQKIVLEQDSPQVSIYSDDITEDMILNEALKKASEETELLAAENALLAEIGRIISSSLDISEVYEGFAQQVRELIPFDRIAISLVDMEFFTFNNQYVFGVPAAGREEGTVVTLSGTMILGAVEANEPMILQGELEELSRKYPMMVRSGLKSVLLAPIVFKNEILGILHMRSLEENAYDMHHLDLATKVAAQIAPAIANSQLYAQHTESEAEAKRLALQNAAIAEIGRIITASLNIEEVYAGFAEQTRRLIGFDRI